MFIRVKSSANSARKSVQIVESVRKGKQVTQRVIRHVGVAWEEDELLRLRELAELILAKLHDRHSPSLFEDGSATERVLTHSYNIDNKNESIPVDLKKLKEEARIITGIHDVYGMLYRQLGFDFALGASGRMGIANEKLMQLVLARIANPGSKRESVRMLGRDFGISLSLKSVYKMMDKITPIRENAIRTLAWRAAESALGRKVNVVFYDCTTLYFESVIEDELKELGYSKDNKFNQSQIMLALLVTAEGLPLGYEVFPGATFEGNTLEVALKEIEIRYEVSEIFFVADSAMLSHKNLGMLESAQRKYIVGARLRSFNKSISETVLDLQHYKPLPQINPNETDPIKVASFDLGSNRKLIVTYSPTRAKKDKYDREKSVQRLLKKMEKSTNPLSLISNYGYKKYIQANKPGSFSLNEAKLKEEARWDGLHGIITNSIETSPADAIQHYHGLWQIEECFRLSKHDLRIRPIFHWTPRRIKAHIAICFMALTCMRHLYNRVAKGYARLSPEKIRMELMHIQTSILRNIDDDTQYAVPSSLSQDVKAIYRIMDIKPRLSPYKLL